MSEYQYYEFQAIDRPLDRRAMAALREITSRAEITPTSLINVYHFGDFKGDPWKLMERYFDAFLYVANWGTHRLMLRLPRYGFEPAEVEPYEVPDVLDAKTTREHVILDFSSQDEDGEWAEGGEGWLASLIPLRAELMAGDLRCLYLAWLSGVGSGMVEEDSLEPPVPPGLDDLTAPLTRFANFLRLDDALLEVAATASTGAGPSGPTSEDVDAWVAALPETEKNRYLVRVMQGEAARVATELLKSLREGQTRHAVRSSRSPPATRRSAASLLEARDVLAEEKQRRRTEQAAKKEARRVREQAAERARYLDSLTGREEELWREVETAISAKQAKEYDRAVTLLQDLRELGERAGTSEAVAARLGELRARHSSKRTLLQRLDKAGLLK